MGRAGAAVDPLVLPAARPCWRRSVHAMLAEYLSFIVLLFSLYTVAGGILVTGDIKANALDQYRHSRVRNRDGELVGTTGAAMILIRPLIRANLARPYSAHVVIFFIILVGNVGGALSPLGDPAAVRRLPARRRFLLDHAEHLAADRRSFPDCCSRSSSSSTCGASVASRRRRRRRSSRSRSGSAASSICV